MDDRAEVYRHLADAVMAYANHDAGEVARILNTTGVTQCVAILGLAAIVVDAIPEGGEVTAEVRASPGEQEAVSLIPAIVAAVGNGDMEGAHFLAHEADERVAHRLIAHLLTMAAHVTAAAAMTSEDEARRN